MSYDLDAVRLPAGMAIEEFYESGAREELAEDDTPPTPGEREEMERLATALQAVDGSAERFDGDDVIDINDQFVQVSVYAKEAGISIPYHFDGPEAQAATSRALAYARVLREVGGYTIYDPQTEEVVDGSHSTLGEYAGGRAATKRIADEMASSDSPPRWKFWLR